MNDADSFVGNVKKKLLRDKTEEGHTRGVKYAKYRLYIIIVLGIISLFILLIASLTFGTIPMTFDEAMNSFFYVVLHWGNHLTTIDEKIIYNLRLPRAIGVITVGAGLCVAGAVMQALIRNPLVDPYVTGVSSGAGFGVMLAVLGGVYISGLSFLTTPISAIIGATGAFFLTMTLAEGSGGRPIMYVLSGVMVGIGLSAGTTLLMTLSSSNTELHGVLFWMFGSFAYFTWQDTIIVMIPAIVIMGIILLYARDLNTILLGDEQARQLGLNTKRFKQIMVVLVSILTALCVAFCGVIGFIGLVIPHMARIILGGDHRLLLPASMVMGANVLLVADIACKTLLSPEELPIGAITAVIGVPFFAYLMLKEGRNYAM